MKQFFSSRGFMASSRVFMASSWANTVRTRALQRGAGVILTLGAFAPIATSGPSMAIPVPPKIYPEPVISASPGGPDGANKPATTCVTTGAPSGDSARNRTGVQRILGYDQAWIYGKGAGQRIAVIDTGVSAHTRLKRLIAGGDYVSSPSNLNPAQWAGRRHPRLDGTWDCDAHGTAIAGVIAGQPSPRDAFVGVAPDATIISIRQYSVTYKLPDKVSTPPTWIGTNPKSAYGPTITLARSIRRAVDLHATIIVIPTPECFLASLRYAPEIKAQNSLGNAVYYAYKHNVLIIAGNGTVAKGSDKSNRYYCTKSNPSFNPLATSQTDSSWQQVQSVASPNVFSRFVLTVAASGINGEAIEGAINGPWVGITSPATGIISLSNDGVSLAQQRGGGTFMGSDFAAAYVAGIAALVRQHFPKAGPTEIMNRLERTAQRFSTGIDDRNNVFGYGIVDPVAAVSDKLDAYQPPYNPGARRVSGIAAPSKTNQDSSQAKKIAAIIAFIVALVGAIAFGVTAPIRSRMKASRPVKHEKFEPQLPDEDSVVAVHIPDATASVSAEEPPSTAESSTPVA